MKYMDLTIAIGESAIAWRPKWAATLVETTDLPQRYVDALNALVGYGDTPLEAAANLLRLAAGMTKENV
jgi:hypothetical protein